MITQDSISQVIDSSVVEEVVGDYVALKRRGVNLLGLCPFHDEKTPSFTVSPAKGIYKCFGCGKAGNSVSFLMDHEQLTFVDAIKHLGSKFNVEVIETENTAAEKEIVDHRENLQIVLNYATSYYHEKLLESEKGKAIGLSYFKNRGISDESIKLWQLGYSADAWRNFADSAINSGYNENYVAEVGLIKKNDKQEWFDIFRDRIMFPINNAQGKVVAFAGRILQKDAKAAKYLNSPETDFYKKSYILYGLHLAKKAIRKEDKCYLTEGYLDVISLYQNGIENVVAASGTSFTEGQAKLIKRFTDNVTVLFDGDAAGVKAAFRSIDMLLGYGFNVRVVPMPDGEDPDSLCQSLGANKFKQFLADNEKDFIIYKSALLMDESNVDPIKKSEFVQDILSSIAQINNPVKRSFYVKECADLMQIEEGILTHELNKLMGRSTKAAPNFYTKEPNEPVAKEQNLDKVIQEGIQLQEKALIKMLILHGQKQLTENQKVADYMIRELKEDETIFTHEMARQALEIYIEQVESGSSADEKFFISKEDSNLVAFVADLLSYNYDLSEGWLKNEVVVRTMELNYAQDCLSAIQWYKIKKANQMIIHYNNLLKDVSQEEEREVQEEYMAVISLKRQVTDSVGNVIG